MRITNTFLLIALLTFSYSNAFDFASLAETNEINASPYGKSLLETVSLTLEQKGNVNEIQKLLNDLLYKLNQDQKKDDFAWKKENARLKAKIAKLTKEIESLRKHLLRLEADLTKYKKLRDQAAKNLNQYNNQLSANNKSLSRNSRRRKNDHAEFLKNQSDHTDVVNAINAVIRELKKLVGSVSAGRPEHVRENKEERRDRLHKAFIQLSKDETEIQNFIQTATTADQKSLANLINALKKVRDSTKKSLNDDEFNNGMNESVDSLSSSVEQMQQGLDSVKTK